jgi:methionine sulfoxide reductase heme-binding subunit
MTSSTALWYASRATGVVCLVLFSAVVVLGVLVNRRGRLPGLPRFAVTGLHRNLSLLAVVFLVIHVLTAVADGYVSIQLAAAVVPFVSHYEPFWLGLGAVSLDLIAALVVTSLLRSRIPARWWRAVHWLAYAAYPVAVAHSIGSSADLRSGGLLALTVACLLAVAGAAGYRLARALTAVPRWDRVPARLAAPPGRRPAVPPGAARPDSVLASGGPVPASLDLEGPR